MFRILVFGGRPFLEVKFSPGVEDKNVGRAMAQPLPVNIRSFLDADYPVVFVHHFQGFVLRIRHGAPSFADGNTLAI
jgi:hypothetical protein